MAFINRNRDTRLEYQQWADSATVTPPSSDEAATGRRLAG
jgi:hypothetical protein